jgi:Predicted membrane protein (DUF2061)
MLTWRVTAVIATFVISYLITGGASLEGRRAHEIRL